MHNVHEHEGLPARVAAAAASLYIGGPVLASESQCSWDQHAGGEWHRTGAGVTGGV